MVIFQTFTGLVLVTQTQNVTNLLIHALLCHRNLSSFVLHSVTIYSSHRKKKTVHKHTRIRFRLHIQNAVWCIPKISQQFQAYKITFKQHFYIISYSGMKFWLLDLCSFIFSLTPLPK